MTELPWISVARKYIGLREIKGPSNSSTITRWLEQLKAWWRDDETPWCGVYVGHCMKESSRALPQHWYRAIAWLDTGTELDSPAYGCIVVFSRVGGGHVGFVVGRDQLGNIMVLGGNQADAVNIKPFAPSRVTGYRWPALENGQKKVPSLDRYNLPLLTSDGRTSSNEA